MTAAPHDSFSVLFVCTGNICRSPLAERLFFARLVPALPITVSSAGTNGLTGRAMDKPSALVLRELGGDGNGHVARRLTVRHIDDADLILTAESGHRSAVVQSEPLAFRKTFTIREFGRLSAALAPLPGPITVPSLRTRVTSVAGQRGQVDAPGPGADDIGDPFGASLEFTRATGGKIAAALDAVCRSLGIDGQPR